MPVTKVYEARYIDAGELRALLSRLFPGQWVAAARLGRWVITTPRPLTKAEIDACTQKKG
ncbi:hypothetical protein K432DRAFT_387269 [Lepidopterella palustris CBS 459.81]|uniref:Uncharacterized protein n=1 Tax=Lepidopterella palustris CBS 459.81 TaxID=1314670 RepID=A0A8E2DXQ8_9PEZI|nr:hypothetical protein K432DRAFT_387269 [Lepidopterella palustris CBS 459.81]